MRYRNGKRRRIAGRLPGDRSVGSMTRRIASKCHSPHTQVFRSNSFPSHSIFSVRQIREAVAAGQTGTDIGSRWQTSRLLLSKHA